MRRKKNLFTFDLSSFSPYLPFAVFSLLFIIGVLIGNITVGRIRTLTDLSTDFLKNFIDLRARYDFFTVLKDAALSVLPYYLVMFLFGASVLGCVTSPVILLCKGIGYGCVSGFLYFTYKLEGIIFNLLIMIPSTLFSAFGLIMLAKEASGFSYLLCGVCMKNSKPVNISADFKNFYIRSLISLAPAAVSIVLDIGMSVLFVNYFNFKL